MHRGSRLGEVGGGEQVPVGAELFRKGSAFMVWREICWRLAASAREAQKVSASGAWLETGNGFRSRLTNTVNGDGEIPLRGGKLLLSFRAAAVAELRHRGTGGQFG